MTAMSCVAQNWGGVPLPLAAAAPWPLVLGPASAGDPAPSLLSSPSSMAPFTPMRAAREEGVETRVSPAGTSGPASSSSESDSASVYAATTASRSSASAAGRRVCAAQSGKVQMQEIR